MVGIFGNQHMRDCGFCRQTCWYQSGWSWRLHNTISAGATCIFRTMGNNDTELRRDHIQSFRNIFANTMQATTAGADQAFRLNHFVNTRQVFWKRTSINDTWLGCSFI